MAQQLDRKVLVVFGALEVLAVGLGAAAGWWMGRDALLAEQEATYGRSADALYGEYQSLSQLYQELYDRCEPLEGSERDRLIEAQEKVEDLRAQVQAKEAEIAALEVKAKENAALRVELERRKQELGRLKSALQAAEQEREQLVEKLKDAIAEVAQAHQEARAARRETLAVKWEEFKAQALLRICKKGTRARIEKCRSVVSAAFTPERERRYRQCVRKKQAVPELREAQKGEELPAFAEWLDQDSRFTRNRWYILFCDPTLPEAGSPDGNPVGPEGSESDPVQAQGREDAFLEGLEKE